MSTARRLESMYESKQQEWEVVHDRLTSLRQARTIETDPENKFKFDQRIKIVEQELKALQNELTQLEQQISQLKYIDHKSPAVTSSAFVNKNYGAEAKNHINYQTPSLSTFLILRRIIASLAILWATTYIVIAVGTSNYGYLNVCLPVLLIGYLMWRRW
jgi:hypothetical protein